MRLLRPLLWIALSLVAAEPIDHGGIEKFKIMVRGWAHLDRRS
jgi:hypothetical protein